LAAELDSGPLLAQTQLTPAAGESVLAVTAELFVQGAELLLEQLEAIVSGAPGSPQAGAGDYDSWPTPAQVREFHRRGGALLRFADLRLLLTGRR
jgi:methionyl-tRNA formyltransferase